MILGDFCDIATGLTARGRLESTRSGGLPAVQIRDVQAGGMLNANNLERYQIHNPADRYLVSGGEVIFKSRGEPNTAVAVGQLSEPAVAILPLFILRPRHDVALPEYIAWTINQRDIQRRLDEQAQGTGIRMISKATLERIDIPLPDLETQGRIVTTYNLACRESALLRDLADRREQLCGLILTERARLLQKKGTSH